MASTSSSYLNTVWVCDTVVGGVTFTTPQAALFLVGESLRPRVYERWSQSATIVTNHRSNHRSNAFEYELRWLPTMVRVRVPTWYYSQTSW